MRLVSLALCLAIAAPALAADEVRPISDAERAAVAAAADYLSRGPEAVYEQLASMSPLRQLPKGDALSEIEVRLGPPAGASWELQTVVPALKDEAAAFAISYPSGADEAVMFELASENGAYKIKNLRILAEPSDVAPLFPAETSAPVKNETSRLPLGAGLLGALMAIGAAFAFPAHRAAARVLLALSVATVGAGVYLGVRDDSRFRPLANAPVAVANKVTYPRLGVLLPLRRAMAEGTGGVEAASQHLPLKGLAHDVASLWKAQADLQQLRVDDVARALSAFPSPSQTPLAEILRARLAFFQAKEVDAVLAYEHAISLGPGRDGLWLETASALETLGFDDRAETYLRRLSRMGSRDANVYYSLAMLAANDNKEDDAESALYRAWNLRPAERRALFSAAALWSTLRKPRITGVIRLNSAAEATFASEVVSRRAIALPADAQPSVSGDYLHIRIGQQELSVPGGAALAPQGTAVVDAGAWSRLEEEKALQDFAQLVSVARNAGAYTQPLLRGRIERCAAALAMHNRWNHLIQLTDGVSAKSENVPTDVLFLRDVALQRAQRLDDARVLLADLARSPVLMRRNDPQTFVELGEMLASVDLFDAAIKVLDRAAAVRSSASVEERVSKIQMNRQLATKYQTYNSGHFEIHYPDDVSPLFATQIGNVMESELKRLQKWVAVPNFRTTVVNVVWWRDFRSTLTGSDFILGLYQGKITVPLAGIPDFYPPIVAILTHELLHAMLAQATNDSAPHWFQEGLAQRVEMVEIQRNAFNMYDDERLLSVSLLDAVLRGSPDPEMIGESYIVSQTIIRYIEATYGRQGIAKMIAAFRDGATTEEAIQQLSGQSVAEFDTRLRAWGRAGMKIFENQELVSYMQREEGDLRWTRK
jgi:tetratricopeptide (TPR) repeat protein